MKGDGIFRILLVDDVKDNQFLIKAYLKNSPCQFEIAQNGQEAVEKYMAGAFDLVLMDVQMPVKDGYTATNEIRAYEKENN
ncbi:MAG: response regulator, partial [Nitrospinae bacterium]|nr:response regulator [Nitrospinota bacterium]